MKAIQIYQMVFIIVSQGVYADEDFNIKFLGGKTS